MTHRPIAIAIFNPRRWAPLALLLLWPAVALAHIQSGEAGGFVSGLSHPVSGLDHVLAMVAVGLWRSR